MITADSDFPPVTYFLYLYVLVLESYLSILYPLAPLTGFHVSFILLYPALAALNEPGTAVVGVALAVAEKSLYRPEATAVIL